MELPHRVRRLRWQARAADARSAFALRRELHERADAVQATIARLLDRAVPGAEVWHLPRLELRLAIDRIDDLEAALEPALERALREAIGVAGAGADLAVAPDGRAPASDAVAREGQQRPDAVAREAFVEYVSRGSLPWVWAGLDAARLDAALRAEARRAAEAELREPGTVTRLWPADAPLARIGALLRWLPWLPASLRLHWLQAHASAAPLGGASGDVIRAAVLRDDDPELAALWLAWPAATAPIPSESARRALAAWLDTRRDRGAPWPELARRFDRVLQDQEPPARAAAAPPGTGTPSHPVGENAPWPRPDALAAEPGQLVPIAGLVLLHPFLPRLLQARGVVEAGAREILPARLPRGCALLHALAQGDDAAAEFRLPLAKLLLGAAPDAPLSAALPALDDADRAEVVALLDAVRGHWSALRGTGIEGFRLSFLQRRGLLARGEGHWQLRLEREPFDVVLATLPWSIGLIRLPWMPVPLQVEWPVA